MTKQSFGQLSIDTNQIKQQKNKNLYEIRKKQLKKNLKKRKKAASYIR
tara:strand:- start:2402 stop:2545 length:144 start_codon:yes stop_codon:yes gene_type:complete